MAKNERMVKRVVPQSPAWRAGLRPGDELRKINGYKFVDMLDLLFYSDEEELEIVYKRPTVKEEAITAIESEGEFLGLELAPMQPRACRNSCLFCFVDQLPPGMRSELYFKDEDYRYSFLDGNYITASRLTAESLERIVRLRLSPLYLSIHATDEKVRQKLLGNSRSRPILPIMKDLAAGGIRIHTQIVICPGINDGIVLEQTLLELAALYPAVASIALVPVGLTDWREGLFQLRHFSPDDAQKILELYFAWRHRLVNEFGRCFLHLADEIWLFAGKRPPASHWYGDFEQIENGVGLIAAFKEDWRRLKRRKKRSITVSSPLHVLTGRAAAGIVTDFLEDVEGRGGPACKLHIVKRPYMGHKITVAGLVLGRDVRDYVTDAGLDGILLLPDIMLRQNEKQFLDGVSISELAEVTGLQISIFDSSPTGFIEKVFGLSFCNTI